MRFISPTMCDIGILAGIWMELGLERICLPIRLVSVPVFLPNPRHPSHPRLNSASRSGSIIRHRDVEPIRLVGDDLDFKRLLLKLRRNRVRGRSCAAASERRIGLFIIHGKAQIRYGLECHALLADNRPLFARQLVSAVEYDRRRHRSRGRRDWSEEDPATGQRRARQSDLPLNRTPLWTTLPAARDAKTGQEDYRRCDCF